MTIKEAAKTLDIKEHVLRYWEEELDLNISRNEMGYREYSDRDIEMFRRISELRKQGLGLKEIHDGIISARANSDCRRTEGNSEVRNPAAGNAAEIKLAEGDAGEESSSLPDEIKVVDFKTAQLQSIMNKIVANAFRENRDIIIESLMDELSENTVEFFDKNKKAITSSLRGELTEDVMKQIDVILREQEERDEARFRKLDETIRQLQNARSEVAATRSKKHVFRR